MPEITGMEWALRVQEWTAARIASGDRSPFKLPKTLFEARNDFTDGGRQALGELGLGLVIRTPGEGHIIPMSVTAGVRNG